MNNPPSAIRNPQLFRRRLSAWFRAHGRDLPWRRTHDPYAVMVSEFMLQQTQVATVRDYYERWMRRFPDFSALAAASEADVLHAWEGLGYYSRARNLHRAARQVVAEHGGALPDDLAAIARLPGVGRYTAGAIASFAFDRATPIIDANIARVLARLFDVREPIDSTGGAEILWRKATDLVPRRGGRTHNSALMELGALVCLARRPQCLICPVHSDCQTRDPEALPVKRPRRETVALFEDCAWIVDGDHLLLEQQVGTRWRGLWKLPAFVRPDRDEHPPLFEIDYTFTHHRVRLRVFADATPAQLRPAQQWKSVATLDRIAFPSPHRRALRQLLTDARFPIAAQLRGR